MKVGDGVVRVVEREFLKKSERLLVRTDIPQTSAQSMHKDRTNRGALLFVL